MIGTNWNRTHKQGETTKNASQIALFYLDELTKQEGFYFSDRDDTKDKLIRTILNGSGEVKTELTRIVNEVVAAKDTSHRGRYYELVKMMLSSIMDSSEVSKHLPAEVIRLANLFWFHTPKKNSYSLSGFRRDLEQYFGLQEGHLRYYPASAFQTPIFQLLQADLQATVAFILSFTNKSIEYFAKTDLGQYEAEEIDVVVDDSGATVMGGNPATLYSLSKLLNDIGSGFKDDGIHWLSDMLNNNPELSTEELEVNTVYYLETLVRSYVLRNRDAI
jgi:hypothetical protein